MHDVERFLAGKGALVTGSSSGAGAEIARALARAGARGAVHYRGARAGAAAVAGGVRAAGGGRIVNLGATSAYVRSHSVYGLAKAALLHLTESLAVELAPAITVNAVVPSQIASARTDTLPAYKQAAIAATPLGRLVTEPEIGRMVGLLCSPAFDFVTGRAIVMDGGRSPPVFPRPPLAAGTEP